ncbi:hypothetical protein [Nocardia sp. NBC_01388]|uniref:hypothetical protein n=1 Tax=Nocardia sp. NBC_01388 TaxID=2903596 RepID=UPI00324F735B
MAQAHTLLDDLDRENLADLTETQAATVLTGGRYSTDKPGYDEMLTTAKRFTDRVWAIEGCNGIGFPVVDQPVR